MFDLILTRVAGLLGRGAARMQREASLTGELRRLESGWAWTIASRRLGLIQDPGR